jgi:soluble lytic murein transglycosylase-like protein
LIRQESVFQPRAKSPANAYGLMQLLLPTAKATARKYGTTVPASFEELFSPPLNIELGTAYMRDQFDKFGRIEYVAVAYNAGPGRVGPWRASLPLEIDEFVEKIPFKETKSYVQGKRQSETKRRHAPLARRNRLKITRAVHCRESGYRCRRPGRVIPCIDRRIVIRLSYRYGNCKTID